MAAKRPDFRRLGVRLIPAGKAVPRQFSERGVAEGTRTPDHRDHNPGLYQLSYRHRVSADRIAAP
jgi:hypothetical protein